MTFQLQATDDLSVQLEDDVLTVELARAKALNALTATMVTSASHAVEQVANRDDVRVIVIKGQGRAFCSGAELGDVDRLVESSGELIDAASQFARAVRSSPFPVVAVVHGPAVGMGVSIALAADLVLMRDDAYFQLAFAKIGLMPDGGATLLAAAAGRAKVMRMALLAERMTAAQASRAGLVSAVWNAEEFDAQVSDVIANLRRGPRAAFALTKRAINDAMLSGPELDAALVREKSGQMVLAESPDFREGVEAFLGRREATFTD